jgi:hypothetical protein
MRFLCRRGTREFSIRSIFIDREPIRKNHFGGRRAFVASARRGSPAVVLSKAGRDFAASFGMVPLFSRMTRLRRKPAKVTLLTLLTADFDWELVVRPRIPARPMVSD